MNERIQELAEQASIFANTSYIPDSTWQVVRDAKFAELIVEECATAIIQDSRLNDVRSAANGCVRTIREHFGVEE
jgi:hypothetical protein